MTKQTNSNLSLMAYEISAAKESINKSLQNFSDAWNMHDAKALSMIFAEDADFTNVFGQTFSGRDNIETQHAPLLSTIFKSSNLVFNEIKVRLINEKIAAVDGFWNMNGAMDMQGKPWPNRKGLMNLIMINKEETWQILVMHNMDFRLCHQKHNIKFTTLKW